MKTRIFSLMMIGLLAITSVSCVKDADPVFDKKPSVRMQEALKNAQDILRTAPHGWRMDDFMNESNTTAIMGGYSIALKFTEDKVTAWGEMMNDVNICYTSLYIMTTDDGPVLSFDDNNYILHYYSTPSGTGRNQYGQTGHYQALGGDFEFLILEASADCVKLKGKRGGQKINLYPLDKEPAEFLAGVVKVREEMIVTHYEDASNNLSMDLDRDNRHILINYFEPATAEKEAYEENILDIAYLYTETGIHLKRSLKSALKGVTAEGREAFIKMLEDHDTQDMTWDGVARSLSFSGIVVAGVLPEGWLPYNDYIGDYVLSYNNGTTIDIKLEKDEYMKSYILSGLNSHYTLTVSYDLASGALVLSGQTIGQSGEYTYWFAPWSLVGGGSLWYSTSYGMRSVLDQASYDADPAHFSINWVSGNSAAGKPIDSFILYQRHSSGSGNSAIQDASWYFPTTNYRMAYLSSFTKK